MVEAYLQSLTSSTPLEADAHAREAQLRIDEAIQMMNEVEHHHDLVEQFAAMVTREGYFGSVLWLLQQLGAGADLLEIDANERQRLAKTFGREISQAQGAEFLIRQQLAGAFLDPQRHEATVKAALDLFTSDDNLRGIAEEPEALELLARARDAVVGSLLTFDGALSSATSDSERLRRAVGLYRELFEDGAAPLFAWYLRVARSHATPVQDLMRRDSTDLLRSVQARPKLAELFFGADGTIRNAASHGHAYRLVENDSVLISLRSNTTTISVDVLVDLLLGLVESLLACFWALDNELGRLGFTAHNSGLALSQESLLPVAAAILDSQGLRVVSAEQRDGQWLFVLDGGPKVDPWPHVYGVAHKLPDGVGQASFSFRGLPDGHIEVASGDLSKFIRGGGVGALDAVSRILTLLDSARLDGKSALLTPQLRKAASIASRALLIDDDPTAVGVLRACRRAAERRADAETVNLCDESLSEWRFPRASRSARLKMKIALWYEFPNPSLPRVKEITVTGADGP